MEEGEQRQKTRRDVRRETTHAAVFDAARATFFEYGYEQTTILDIAREAGVSAGTVLNAAPSKAALLIKVLQDEYVSLRRDLDDLEPTLNGPVSDRIFASLTVSLEVQGRYRELLCTAIGHAWLKTDPSYEEIFHHLGYAWTPLRRVIEQGQSSGELNAHRSVDELMSVLQDLYLGILRQMCRADTDAGAMAPLLRDRVDLLMKACR